MEKEYSWISCIIKVAWSTVWWNRSIVGYHVLLRLPGVLYGGIGV